MHPAPQRSVLPELLDTLHPSDPAAIQSRLELRLINRIMGNHRWLLRTLAAGLQEGGMPGGRILELGAGDGQLFAAAQAAGVVTPSQWHGVDLAPAPPAWPAEATWIQSNLFQLKSLPEAEVVLANLFLHHFEAPHLHWIGTRLPTSCRLFLASEPARHGIHQLQGRVLSGLANLSAVTRHDMERSIQAGFRENELPDWLGLHEWKVRTTRTLFGAYRIQAWR